MLTSRGYVQCSWYHIRIQHHSSSDARHAGRSWLLGEVYKKGSKVMQIPNRPMKHAFTFITPILLGLLTSTQGDPIQSPVVGTISTPESGAVLDAESSFPFQYQTDNWCHQGYSEFNVSLVSGPNAPTFDGVTDTGSVYNAVFNFGVFTVPNFGLPALGIPPPSFLVMPDLGPGGETEYYVTVVDFFFDCPGHILEEFGLTFVAISYSESD